MSANLGCKFTGVGGFLVEARRGAEPSRLNFSNRHPPTGSPAGSSPGPVIELLPTRPAFPSILRRPISTPRRPSSIKQLNPLTLLLAEKGYSRFSTTGQPTAEGAYLLGVLLLLGLVATVSPGSPRQGTQRRKVPTCAAASLWHNNNQRQPWRICEGSQPGRYLRWPPPPLRPSFRRRPRHNSIWRVNRCAALYILVGPYLVWLHALKTFNTSVSSVLVTNGW